jgi:hypothetical protein
MRALPRRRAVAVAVCVSRAFGLLLCVWLDVDAKPLCVPEQRAQRSCIGNRLSHIETVNGLVRSLLRLPNLDAELFGP